MDVAINSNGLLKSINTKANSQIPAILLEMTEIGKSVVKLGTQVDKSTYFELDVDPDELKDVDNETRNQIIDLFALENTIKELKLRIDKETVASEKERLVKDLENTNKSKQRIEAKIGEPSLKLIKKYEAIYGINAIFIQWKGAKIAPQTDHEEFSGIYYRPIMPCQIYIKTKDYVVDTIVYLPNKSPLMKFEVTRPAFVEKVSNMTFDNGVLTGIHINKPSELLAGLKIPSDILKSIAGMPLELLQFRVNYAEAYNNLLRAQIQEIQNKQNLLQLQQQRSE